MALLEHRVQPDFDAFRRCILREGTPERVHVAELFQDQEIKDAVAQRFDLERGLDRSDPFFDLRREIAIQRHLGYDMVRLRPFGPEFPRKQPSADDTAGLQRSGGREWTDESRGPIATWEEFERYPWPDPNKVDLTPLEWLEKNLPDGMAIYLLTSHILEQPTWLMGYETLCIEMYEQPDLVEAVFRRCGEIYQRFTEIICQFSRLGVVWGSDDMGYRTQTLLPPEALRHWALPWHRRAAETAHRAGKLYFLHSCGQLQAIMPDLIDNVRIDAKHSFEDAIEPVTEAKRRYGSRIALLGGIDVDFLCRSDEAAIRRRVRETLDLCQPGGGYALGTGNSVANYVPLDNYLIMLDEGRRWGK